MNQNLNKNANNFQQSRDANELNRLKKVSPPFDVKKCELYESNFFWISAFDAKDTLVATLALKLINLGNMNLATYLRKFASYYVPESKIALYCDSLFLQNIQFPQSIYGLGWYQGEGWIQRSYRKKNLSEVFFKYGMIYSYLIKNVDFSFALSLENIALSGFIQKVGYSYHNLAAFIWNDEKGQYVCRDGISINTSSDIINMIELMFLEMEC